MKLLVKQKPKGVKLFQKNSSPKPKTKPVKKLLVKNSSPKVVGKKLLQENYSPEISARSGVLIDCWKTGRNDGGKMIRVFEEVCIKLSSSESSNCYGCTLWQDDENRLGSGA